MSDAGETMAAGAGPAFPAQLFIWLSPSFPVGAYAYSHGLEAAAALGRLRDDTELEAWLGVLLGHGSIGNDLVLLSVAFRACRERDWPRLAEAAALGLALQPSAERHLETTQQGASFMAAVEAAWSRSEITEAAAIARRASPEGREIAYPVAVAITAAGYAVPLRATLEAYATAVVANLVSAAIRLSVLGQTAGQRLQARLVGRILAAAGAAETATLDDIGGAAFAADLTSLQHETLHTRIFRS